jgi:hypothetical protein
MRGISLIFSILFILAACEPVMNAVPTSEYQGVQTEQELEKPTVQDPCDICTDEETCVDNTCKKIDESTDESKDEPEQTCAFGEAWDGKECACEEGRYWCGEQQKCIPDGDCCFHTQCARFERCVPNQYRARLCAELPSGKLCRLLADNGRTEIVVINNLDTRLGVSDWNNDNSINFTLNNQSLLLFEGKRQEFSGINYYFENLEEYGGYCKEDED